MFCDNGVIVGICQEDAEDVILHDGGVLDSVHCGVLLREEMVGRMEASVWRMLLLGEAAGFQ